MQRLHCCRIEKHEGATTVLVTSEYSAPDETGGKVIGRGNLEVDCLQLFSLFRSDAKSKMFRAEVRGEKASKKLHLPVSHVTR